MDPRRWQRAQELLEQARPMEKVERGVFLREAAGGDAALVELVEGMLSVEDQESRFLEPPSLHGSMPMEPIEGMPSDFELLEPIGRGGLGVVWRARQASLNREVAIKFLSDPAVQSGPMRERFQREAQAVARLQHSNIVRLHETGFAGRVPFLVMELIRGHTLAEELRRLRVVVAGEGGAVDPPLLLARDGRIDIRGVVQLLRTMADALEHAHTLRIVHRDVKPQNIILAPDGTPYLVDFGIALAQDQPALTRSGEMPGTPFYMSPEQVRAQRAQVDHRTDVFSLGVVLYELLTLERPFGGDTTAGVMEAILVQEPRRLRSVDAGLPRALETVCAGALEKDLGRRYASAAELRNDLDRFLRGDSPLWRRPPWWSRAWRWIRRHRVSTAAVSAAVLGTALAYVLIEGLLVPRTTVTVQLSVGPPEAAVNATLHAIRMDDLHMQRRQRIDLGRRPWEPENLAPGTYRFVAESPGFGAAEALRVLSDPEETMPVSLRLAPLGSQQLQLLDVRAGRPSAELEVHFGERGVKTIRYTYTVAPFELQRDPVTNGEFARYLRETDQAEPEHWGGPRPAGWDSMPATAISLSEARAFAEHYGLRLPTWPEMLLAARTEDAWLYPWGNDPLDIIPKLRLGRPEPYKNDDYPKDEPGRAGRWYREHLRAVDQDPEEARGLFGHGGFLGNIWQWTESRHFDAPEGKPVPHPNDVFLVGVPAFWSYASAERYGLGEIIWTNDFETVLYTGFRCARSLDPLSLDPLPIERELP